MQKITPNLWFDDEAEDAVNRYTTAFDDSEIGAISRYDEASADVSGQPEGSVMTVEFELEGQSFVALNGGLQFPFTPAISFVVNCPTTDEMAVRPGGVWRFIMTGPDGDEFPNRIEYDEVEEPELLAYTHGSPDDPEQFRAVVTFDEREDGTTELTMRQQYESAAALDESIAEFGADDGAKQTLGRLADHRVAE